MKIFSVLALQGAQACLNLNQCDNGSSGNAVDTSGSSDDSETSGFRSDCITALTSYDHAHPEEACDAIILHNTYRANHNADPFVIPTKELCDHAQEWADTQANANLPTHTGMTHATPAERPEEGENMAWHSVTGVYAWDMSDATTAWQEEDAWWDFDNFTECTIDPYECQSCIFGPNPFSFECGHFTQNVWKATTSVCIAKSENSQGTYIVARYNPPGNIIGYYTGEHGFEGPLDGNYIGSPA